MQVEKNSEMAGLKRAVAEVQASMQELLAQQAHRVVAAAEVLIEPNRALQLLVYEALSYSEYTDGEDVAWGSRAARRRAGRGGGGVCARVRGAGAQHLLLH